MLRSARLAEPGGRLRTAGSGVRTGTSARLGVHLAYVYYLKLFYKLRQAPAAQVLAERVRLPDNTKLLLLVSSWLRYRLRLVS